MQELPHSNLKQRLNFNKRNYLLFSITLFLFFILVFLQNKLYPLYADDWSYIYAGKSFGESVNIAFRELYNQYFTWGGRMVVHAIAHLLSWMGLAFSDFINSLVFVFFMYIVYRICNKGNEVNPLLFLLISLYLWLIIPAFNSTVFWLVGAANYMWGALIVILFLWTYYSYYINGKERKNKFYILFFFIVGILSGWTNENVFVAQVFFILCLFILLKREKASIPTWAILGLVGVCIGGLFMIAAPGNYIRAEVVKQNLELVDKSTIELILYRILKVGYRYVIYILPAIAVYIAIFYLYKKQTNLKDTKTLFGSLLFFLSGNIACFAMVASYIFPPRAIFGIIIFIVIATGILCANLKIEAYNAKYTKWIVVSVILILFSINYIVDYNNFYKLSEEFSKRDVQVEQQKKEGRNYVIFEGEIKLPSKYDFEDLSDNPSHWLNKLYSKYHGIDSVKIVK